MVRLMLRLRLDSRSILVIVDNRAQSRGRIRHAEKLFSRDFLAGQETNREGWLAGLGRTPRRFTGGTCLKQRQPRMIEKGLPSRGEFNTARVGSQKLGARLVLQIRIPG